SACEWRYRSGRLLHQRWGNSSELYCAVEWNSLACLWPRQSRPGEGDGATTGWQSCREPLRRWDWSLGLCDTTVVATSPRVWRRSARNDDLAGWRACQRRRFHNCRRGLVQPCGSVERQLLGGVRWYSFGGGTWLGFVTR